MCTPLQPSGGERLTVHIIERGHDEICTRLQQLVLVAGTRHTERDHRAGLSGLNAADCVLDHHAPFRSHTEFGGRGEKKFPDPACPW